MITHNTDYYGEAIGRLPIAYRDKPRMATFIASWMAEIQQAEDALWDIFFDMVLANGVLKTDLLNKFGKIVGQPRLGYGNAAYLTLIYVRVRVNKSNGRREELITIASQLCGGVPVILTESYPAAVIIQPVGALLVDPVLVAVDFLGAAVAAGVYLGFVWSPYPAANTITFGSTDASVAVPTSDQSPDSVDLAVPPGGHIASIIAVLGGS